MNLTSIQHLTLDEIEDIERLTLRWLFQAAKDFGMAAHEIFMQSPDDVKDVAEDITREMLDALPGFNVPQRIYGTVDYKKARYIILPDMALRQALFTDSKAEKSSSSATIQMSQTSMRIRQIRAKQVIDQQGFLSPVSNSGGQDYLTTTVFLHFKYADDARGHHCLETLRIFCIPNGKLQDRYNPDANTTFWLAGRNAPTRGEDFRVRVSFRRLTEMSSWRVQQLTYDSRADACNGQWME